MSPSPVDGTVVLDLTRPGALKRLVAHLLIRLLILTPLPAHVQVNAALFPVSMLWPLVGSNEQSDAGDSDGTATPKRHPRHPGQLPLRSMSDETTRRLRSLLLALAPYLVADTPFALEQALWHEVADEMLPAHAAISGLQPWPIVRSRSSFVH
jgi:hypothetical protein